MFNISESNMFWNSPPVNHLIKSTSHKPAHITMQGLPKHSLLLGHLFIVILHDGKSQNKKELSTPILNNIPFRLYQSLCIRLLFLPLS